MRKTASIILLLVLLFNVVGYRAWFYYAEQRSDAALDSKLDNKEYSEADLIAITIPLNNPYLQDAQYSRAYGEITVQGKTLKYVKRKVADGQLTLLCIPDAGKMVIKKAKADLSSNGNDLTMPVKGGSQKTAKSFSSAEYDNYSFVSVMTLFHHDLKACRPAYLVRFTSTCLPAPGKPPRAIA